VSDDATNPVFDCASVEELIVYSHTFPRGMPKEVKLQFREGFIRLLMTYNTTELFELLRGRRLHDIQAIVDLLPPDPKVIASGQVNGMTYTLYEPPPDRPDNS
jgi:hypothetical protein